MTNAQQFTDRIWTVPQGNLTLNEVRSGEWHFRTGTWMGRVDGRGYVVQVNAWKRVLILEFIHGHYFRRRWDHCPGNRAISRRARQLVEDVAAGRIGTIGKGAA